MGGCFICDVKLYGERTRVCSSVTPHSNVPYPEKIAELMGEEFVIVVTPADHMCKKCTSLLTHMDKLENDLKLVKNAMLSYIQKKYGILPADQPVKTLDIVNGHLTQKPDELLDIGQRKVPSGLTIRDNSVSSPLKMLKQQPNSGASKMKIYKCGFCSFQSKELGHVRFHMRTHMNKKTDDETKANQTVTKTLAPALQQQQQQQPQQQQQKKRLYRCQVCSASFDSRLNCLEHIQKDHNAAATVSTTTNEGKGEEIPTKILKPAEVLKSDDIQQDVSPMVDVDDGQQQTSKVAVDTDMLLNDNVPTEGTAADEQEEAQATCEDMPVEEEEAMKVDQEISDNVKGVEEGMAIDGEENKTGDLDIESMLAAIHNDTPTPDVEDVQNIV